MERRTDGGVTVRVRQIDPVLVNPYGTARRPQPARSTAAAAALAAVGAAGLVVLGAGTASADDHDDLASAPEHVHADAEVDPDGSLAVVVPEIEVGAPAADDAFDPAPWSSGSVWPTTATDAPDAETVGTATGSTGPVLPDPGESPVVPEPGAEPETPVSGTTARALPEGAPEWVDPEPVGLTAAGSGDPVVPGPDDAVEVPDVDDAPRSEPPGSADAAAPGDAPDPTLDGPTGQDTDPLRADAAPAGADDGAGSADAGSEPDAWTPSGPVAGREGGVLLAAGPGVTGIVPAGPPPVPATGTPIGPDPDQ